MKLEQQVCSLQLSKKLKDLGVPQESLFYWHTHDGITWDCDHRNFDHRTVPTTFALCSAFTVAELGEMLPRLSVTIRQLINGKEQWTVYADALNLDSEKHAITDTEADARALMLIYLIENKLITTT